MPMLIIEEDWTTEDAANLVENFFEEILSKLDLEACVGLVAAESLSDALITQVEGLPHHVADGLVEELLKALLD